MSKMTSIRLSDENYEWFNKMKDKFNLSYYVNGFITKMRENYEERNSN